ncbi:MAG: radical SAM protein [Spirochaetes bacterium]|nr:radical SAM protein [Spirochaetota bacterium]
MNYSEKADIIQSRIPAFEQTLAACICCGHRCGIDRTRNESGVCGITGDFRSASIASHTLHFGEEPPIVGKGGSGTVFFAGCNLRCVFCQNYQISHDGKGDLLDEQEIASIYRKLADQGACNINLVSPTQYIYPAVLGLMQFYRDGGDIPVVYNTNGYDSMELLTLLDGIVDVYLPDAKYSDGAHAERYSHAGVNYVDVNRQAIREMYRQCGALTFSDDIAVRGVIIRHLVLPDDIAGSYEFLLWLKDNGMTGVTLSIMSQYAPKYRANEYPAVARSITPKEYNGVVDYAVELGFENLLIQEMESSSVYFPDFGKEQPFSNTGMEKQTK